MCNNLTHDTFLSCMLRKHSTIMRPYMMGQNTTGMRMADMQPKCNGGAEMVKVSEARDRIAELVSRAQHRGECFTLTHYGKPVAQLVPLGPVSAEAA